MKTTIIILILMVSLWSCKNTKQIAKTETEAKQSTETEIVKTEETKADTKIVASVAENVTETDNTVIKETITELSKPDSTGKQYPEKIITREISTDKNKQTKTDAKEEVDKTTENKVTETETKAENKTEITETDSKIVKKSQSWKVIALIVLGLVAAGFILYKVKGDWIKNLLKK